jgi:hypothetical protein
MSVVLPVNTRTFQDGVPFVTPTVSKPAGATDVLVQLAAHTTTDWVTGAAGRTLSVLIQKSIDGGANWGSDILGTLKSPQLGKDNVSLPTIATMGIGQDPTNTQYRATITAGGGSVSTGWDIKVQ